MGRILPGTVVPWLTGDALPGAHRLAAMRVEYGSPEKDGSADLDADWLADGWLALLHR